MATDAFKLRRRRELASGSQGLRGTYKGTPGEEGGGLKWMELKNGEPTGSQVRYNPGTPRHYDGKPYWTVIRNDPATGRAVRLDVTEDGVFPR